jgi:outer membrane protein
MERTRTQRCVVLTAFEQVALLLLALSVVPTGWGQETQAIPSAPSVQKAEPSSWAPFDVKEYAKWKPHFPNPIAPYSPREIEAPNLANSPRIDQFMHDGKLYISINDAVALALENNLDIAIFRYNLNIADTDIWRALAGQSVSGVNTGVVQNTPAGVTGQGSTGGVALGGGGLSGGGVSGGGPGASLAGVSSGVTVSGPLGAAQTGPGQGGTSIAPGGAGAGVGGLVSSTLGSGPQTPSFDPMLTGSLNTDHATSVCNTPNCATNQNTISADFSYSQGFHWGMQMAVGFDNSRVASNSLYNLRTPTLNSSFQLTLTQHLLQGFGLPVNTRFIQIAKNNREISDVAFRLQIMSTVDLIENMYWSLVYAYENAKVQREQMSLAQEMLATDKVQVEIGTLAPIEVVRAQSAIAAVQQNLTTALTNLELQQLVMKNAISRTLVDPALADAEVIPTSALEFPAEEKVVPIADLVAEAFQHRPDLAEARINLVNTGLSKNAIRNALLPSLDVSAFYGGTGLGGTQNPAYICSTDPQVCGFKKSPLQLQPVSYGATFTQLLDSSAPDKGVAFTLSIPLRNRAAQATQVRSEFEYRQAQLQLQQLENQIRIDVRNAQYSVQQNRASVVAAQSAVELARQSLELEQKKYKIGASTVLLVLQNQTALTQAGGVLLSAQNSYDRAEVELDRATGLMLEHAGIVIADAERGQMAHTPSIPHVTERPASQPVPANQQPPQD